MKLIVFKSLCISKGILEITWDIDQYNDDIQSIIIKNKKNSIYEKEASITHLANTATIRIDLNVLADAPLGEQYHIYLKSKCASYRLQLDGISLFQLNKDFNKFSDAYTHVLHDNTMLFPIFFIDGSIGIERNTPGNISHIESNIMCSKSTILENLNIDGSNIHLQFEDTPLIYTKDYRIVIFNNDNSVLWRSSIYSKGSHSIQLDILDIIKTIPILDKLRINVYLEYFDGNLYLVSKLEMLGIVCPHKSERYFQEMIIPYHYINEVETDSNLYLTPYISKNHQFSFYISDKSFLLAEKSEVKKSSIYTFGKKIYIKATVDITVGEPNSLIFIHRNNPNTKNLIYPIKKKSLNSGFFLVKSTILCTDIELEQFYWDIYISAVYETETFLIRVKNPTSLSKGILYADIRHPIRKNNFNITPYITRGNALSISYKQKNPYDRIHYKIKEHFAFLLFEIFFKKYFNNKNIWIVYEKFSSSAQDNGFYFFKHSMDTRKASNVYYVIDKKCADYSRVASYKKNVLPFMSFKHMLYILGANLLVSSEAKSHSYAWRKQNSLIIRKLLKKKFVFLQHGVMGLKKVDRIYRKNSGNSCDLFVTSSDYEKNIIQNHFNYNAEDIIVTGLCRWDVLKDRSTSKKEILLMPTWRNWLDEVSTEKFVKSDYYMNYSVLLNNTCFHEMLQREDITVRFYIHPKFRDHLKNFNIEHDHIKLIPFGEQPLNELIMSCSLLITDYSSVAWDVYYQNKPIVFYQFDYEYYNQQQGSYMDMETELFGDRVFQVNDLIQTIQYYVEHDFTEKEIFKETRKTYFKWQDHNNSERTYQEIQHYIN